MTKSQLLFIFFSFLPIQFVQSQIIEEGKGIDSIRIGIKESKVIKFLGSNYVRKKNDDGEYVLVYSKKALSISFDKDSIVYEISIKPTIKRKTSKGLIIINKLKILDVQKIYGNDGWYTESDGNIDNGYDSGIVFRTQRISEGNEKTDFINTIYIDSNVTEIIIEQSKDDFSFQEYVEGIYIPKNLKECFIEIDKNLKSSDKQKIKLLTEKEFTGNSHFFQGLWIRNNWALWKGSRLSKYFNNLKIFHPDDMSGIVLKSYYRYLLGENILLEKQIEFYKIYWKVNRKPSKENYPSDIKESIEFNTSQSYYLNENDNPGCVHIQTNSSTESVWIYDFYFGWKLISQQVLIKLNKTDYDTREQTLREIFNTR